MGICFILLFYHGICPVDNKKETEYILFMGTTTIHFPDDLLSELDRAAARHSFSRNRYVLDACRSALSREAGAWPEGFFNNNLSEADADILAEAALELEREVYSRRRNRGAPAL